MGDCRLRVLVAKELQGGGSVVDGEPPGNNDSINDGSNSNGRWRTFLKTVSADATVREVMEDLVAEAGTRFDDVSFWDCTSHPARDVTTWPTHEFPDLSGPKSKTAYNAGWFPSGELQIVPRGEAAVTSEMQQLVDVQYNDTSRQTGQLFGDSFAGQPTRRVELLSTATLDPSQRNLDKPMPSELMRSVETRFEGDTLSSLTTTEAIRVRQERKRDRTVAERERNKRLEDRIQKVRLSASKGKKASATVQKMLIKSRCRGSKNLKQQDRVFLRLVFFNDHTTYSDANDTTINTVHPGIVNSTADDVVREDYRYFSRQDTVARVMSWAQNNDNVTAGTGNGTTANSSRTNDDSTSVMEIEILVRVASQSGSEIYRRLPVTLRLYEAIEKGLLHDVDDVMVRRYDPSTSSPVPSALIDVQSEAEMETKQAVEATVDEIRLVPTDIQETSTSSTTATMKVAPADTSGTAVNLATTATTTITVPESPDNDAAPNTSDLHTPSGSLSDKDKDTIRVVLANLDSTKSAKKKSKTSLKVKSMLMKSKAKGDKKRTAQMQDRFFFELVVVRLDDESNGVVDFHSPVFLSRRDTIGRVVNEFLSGINGTHQGMFMASKGDGLLVDIADSARLEDSAKDGSIEEFGRVVFWIGRRS